VHNPDKQQKNGEHNVSSYSVQKKADWKKFHVDSIFYGTEWRTENNGTIAH